jgi:hypothetical protein
MVVIKLNWTIINKLLCLLILFFGLVNYLLTFLVPEESQIRYDFERSTFEIKSKNNTIGTYERIQLKCVTVYFYKLQTKTSLPKLLGIYKTSGFNCIQVSLAWNVHEQSQGKYGKFQIGKMPGPFCVCRSSAALFF